ncbi:hypothetical protein ACJMK2_024922 [Sinanodonta woodiana]|uniref:Uncharacterized protein n=1 Tax=Sinanodonta woodiana TaxID=1069815 RepID=A0ABD3XGT0_SINWO
MNRNTVVSKDAFIADWKHEVYRQGENATICTDIQTSTGKGILEITFTSYTSNKLAILVMLYVQMEEKADYNRKYTGRVHHVKTLNASFSFILQHVDFVDSGQYTALENSREVGKASIIVPRRLLFADYHKLLIMSFMCTTANISAIKIDMITSTRTIRVVKYDVRKGQCIDNEGQYIQRVQNCAFTGKNFSFTFRDVSWLDKGVYAAWDSTDILLDSVLLDVHESNEISSMESPHGYFNSGCVTIPACPDAENEVWVRLVFAAVGVALTIPLTVASTLLILWKKGSFQINRGLDINSDQNLKMVPSSKKTTKTADADVREYEEPRSNTTDRRIYLEPIGINTLNTEDHNLSGSCSKEYEKLHPYGNQGNNTYSSLGPEHIIEVSKRPILRFN